MKPFLSFGKIKNAAGELSSECTFVVPPSTLSLSGNQNDLADLIQETLDELPVGKSVKVDFPQNVQPSWKPYDFMGPEMIVSRPELGLPIVTLMWESENADTVWINGPAELFAGREIVFNPEEPYVYANEESSPGM